MLPYLNITKSLAYCGADVNRLPAIIKCNKCGGALYVTFYNKDIYFFCTSCKFGDTFFGWYCETTKLPPLDALESMIQNQFFTILLSNSQKNAIILQYDAHRQYTQCQQKLITYYNEHNKEYDTLNAYLPAMSSELGLVPPDFEIKKQLGLTNCPIFMNEKEPVLVYRTELLPFYYNGGILLTPKRATTFTYPFHDTTDVLNPLAAFIHKHIFVTFDMTLFLHLLNRQYLEGSQAVLPIVCLLAPTTPFWSVAWTEEITIITPEINTHTILATANLSQYGKTVRICVDPSLNRKTHTDYINTINTLGLLTFFGKLATNAQPADHLIKCIATSLSHTNNVQIKQALTVAQTKFDYFARVSPAVRKTLEQAIPIKVTRAVAYKQYVITEQSDGWYAEKTTNTGHQLVSSLRVYINTVYKHPSQNKTRIVGTLHGPNSKTGVPCCIEFGYPSQFYAKLINAALDAQLAYPIIDPKWKADLLNIALLFSNPKTCVTDQEFKSDTSESD